MAITSVMFDTAADPGARLDPAVRAEIDVLAPTTIDTGDIKSNMIADQAVTAEKIYPGAVGHTQLDTGAVHDINLDAGAVTTAALAAHAVTAEKAGTGVVTAYDYAGNPLASTDVYLTAAQYNAIAIPDPNTTYNIVG